MMLDVWEFLELLFFIVCGEVELCGGDIFVNRCINENVFGIVEFFM